MRKYEKQTRSFSTTWVAIIAIATIVLAACLAGAASASPPDPFVRMVTPSGCSGGVIAAILGAFGIKTFRPSTPVRGSVPGGRLNSEQTQNSPQS